MTYEELLPKLRDELVSLGVSAAVLRYADTVSARAVSPAVALGIKSCSVAANGFDVSFSLTLLSPRSNGAAGCATLFSQLSNAVSALSSAFTNPVLACGDTSFDTKTDCFVCRATLSAFVASSEGGGSVGEGVFLDFAVMGVEKLG